MWFFSSYIAFLHISQYIDILLRICPPTSRQCERQICGRPLRSRRSRATHGTARTRRQCSDRRQPRRRHAEPRRIYSVEWIGQIMIKNINLVMSHYILQWPTISRRPQKYPPHSVRLRPPTRRRPRGTGSTARTPAPTKRVCRREFLSHPGRWLGTTEMISMKFNKLFISLVTHANRPNPRVQCAQIKV